MGTKSLNKFESLLEESSTDALCFMLSVISCYKEALERYNRTLNIFDLNDLIASINMLLLLTPKYTKSCFKNNYPVYLTVQRFYKLAVKQKETIEGIQKARRLLV